jgi:hypothetical protein
MCVCRVDAVSVTLASLEALPGARVLSFDLSDFPWTRPTDALLRAVPSSSSCKVTFT